MFKKSRLMWSVAAVGVFVSLAQGGTIVFNTDTGYLSSDDGATFGAGTNAGSTAVDAANRVCTWTFTDNLVISSGTTLQFVGSNRASVQANNIILGSVGGAGIVINASSYTDVSGSLVRGAGGGLGGSGAGGGAGADPLFNGGDGGSGGDGAPMYLAAGVGHYGSAGQDGLAGTAAYRGSAGRTGAGAMDDTNQTGGNGGSGGQRGEGAGMTWNGGTGATTPFDTGDDGRQGADGKNGGTGCTGYKGAGGAYLPQESGASAFAAGNGGSGGGGGGGGGSGGGAQGGGGGGGAGGGASILIPGPGGGAGGDGGAGGRGGDGGTGGAGGGAVELVAKGTLCTYSTVSVLASGQHGRYGTDGRDGTAGTEGTAGAPGVFVPLFPMSGAGGQGGTGGKGGDGGTGGDGGGGAGGTVRLAGTLVYSVAQVYGQVGGGGGPAPGADGRLIIAQDVNSGVNVNMGAGSLVTGAGNAAGLHRHSAQLNADAPRLLGLAEGYDATGVLADSADDLNIQRTSLHPVLICQDLTHLGDDYVGYDMVMLTPGTRNIKFARLTADPDAAGTLYTGPEEDRRRIDLLDVNEVYGFLVPEGGITMHLKYNFGRNIFRCVVDLDAGTAIDPIADGLVYELVDIRGVFGLSAAPAKTKELVIGDEANLTVKIDADGCDLLTVLGSADLDGKLILDFSEFSPVQDRVYRFLKAGSYSGRFYELEVVGIDADRVDYDMLGGTFSVTPEPASLGLLAMGAVGLLRRRRI